MLRMGGGMSGYPCVIRYIVERFVVSDREVVSMSVRPEAKPFVEDYPVRAVVMAPPDGCGALAAKPEEKLAAYLLRRRRTGTLVTVLASWRPSAS